MILILNFPHLVLVVWTALTSFWADRLGVVVSFFENHLLCALCINSGGSADSHDLFLES